MWWPSLQSIILWSKSFSWLENNANFIWLSHYSDNRCDLTLRRSHSCVEFWYILIVRATMMRLNIFRIENQAKSPLSGTPQLSRPPPSPTFPCDNCLTSARVFVILWQFMMFWRAGKFKHFTQITVLKRLSDIHILLYSHWLYVLLNIAKT